MYDNAFPLLRHLYTESFKHPRGLRTPAYSCVYCFLFRLSGPIIQRRRVAHVSRLSTNNIYLGSPFKSSTDFRFTAARNWSFCSSSTPWPWLWLCTDRRDKIEVIFMFVVQIVLPHRHIVVDFVDLHETKNARSSQMLLAAGLQ